MLLRNEVSEHFMAFHRQGLGASLYTLQVPATGHSEVKAANLTDEATEGNIPDRECLIVKIYLFRAGAARNWQGDFNPAR